MATPSRFAEDFPIRQNKTPHFKKETEKRQQNIYPIKTKPDMSIIISIVSNPQDVRVKNTVNNSQDNISPQEPNNPSTVVPERCSIVDEKHRDLKGAFMTMKEISQEEMNKSIKIQ